jgi:hypothetical protein
MNCYIDTKKSDSPDAARPPPAPADVADVCDDDDVAGGDDVGAGAATNVTNNLSNSSSSSSSMRQFIRVHEVQPCPAVHPSDEINICSSHWRTRTLYRKKEYSQQPPPPPLPQQTLYARVRTHKSILP